MTLGKIFRSFATLILVVTITLINFVRPAYALDTSFSSSFAPQDYTPPGELSDTYALDTSFSSPFWNGFFEGAGAVVGGAVGTVVTCYAVDALIAPALPPVAVYLAGICPAAGVAAGGIGGAVGTKIMIEAF